MDSGDDAHHLKCFGLKLMILIVVICYLFFLLISFVLITGPEDQYFVLHIGRNNKTIELVSNINLCFTEPSFQTFYAHFHFISLKQFCLLRFSHIVRHLELKGAALPLAHEQLADEEEDEHHSQAGEASVEDVVPFPVPFLLYYVTDTFLVPCTDCDCSCRWEGCSGS